MHAVRVIVSFPCSGQLHPGLPRGGPGHVHGLGAVQGQQQRVLPPRLLPLLQSRQESRPQEQPGPQLLPSKVSLCLFSHAKARSMARSMEYRKTLDIVNTGFVFLGLTNALPSWQRSRGGQAWPNMESRLEGAPVGSWRRVTSYQDHATSNAATATLELVSL